MSDPRDDLASAWLDGELTDADVGSRPDRADLEQARDELARARHALARPVLPPLGLADRQIAAALDALQPGDVSDGAPVVPLQPGRSRRSARVAGRAGSAPAWLSRAAVAVVLLGAVGAAAVALSRGGTGEDDQFASVSAPGSEQSTAGGAAPETDSRLEAQEAPSDRSDGAGSASGGSAAGASALASPAAPLTISEAATARLAETVVAPDDLRRELEVRFGPASTWGADEASRGRCLAVRPSSGSGEVLAAVPVERDGVALELVVPASGPAYFADPASCQRVP